MPETTVVRAHPVVIRSAGHVVQGVDPTTRQCTGEAQQFLLDADGRLTLLRRADWVADPTVIDVDAMHYR
jgi:hypothetical protein